MKKSIHTFFLYFLLFISASLQAQTPQWQWAKGIGGNHQEGLLNAGNTLQIDSLGNSYELIVSQSTSMVIGGTFYFNPNGTGNHVSYFVKYNPTGNVVWVKKFGNYPAVNGGGPIIPQSFCTNFKGESFLQFYFVDSISLGGVHLIDTIVGHSNGNYCIAKYDANGNVQYIKAHKGRNSGLLSIRQFMENKMFAVGLVNQSEGDTINGNFVPQGVFMALMDTLGYLTTLKSIGRDSLSANFLMDSRSFTLSNKSVYMQTYFYRPLIYQTTIPINNIRQYADTSIQGTGKNLFIKFDSLLNFQWFKTGNAYVGSHMAADSHDNLYIGATSPSTLQVDTIKIDNLNFPMPFIPPYGVNAYLCTFKFNGNGILQWQNNIIVSGSTGVSSVCFDRQDNVFLYGAYQTYLIAGNDTLYEPSNLFVNKISAAGSSIWVKATQHSGRYIAASIKEDGHGNIYVNGQYADPNYPIAFGTDTLICHTPIANYPLAADIFNARLGNCNPLIPMVDNSSSLNWCGADSVILTSSASPHYLWNTGDTTQSIVVNNSGNFNVFTSDNLGCYASSNSIIVTANSFPVVPIISLTSGLLQSSSAPSYQWYLNGTIIAGANSQSYTPNQIGNYTVEITDNTGCSSTSTPYNYLATVINTMENEINGVTVFPNPFTTEATISFSKEQKNSTIKITDILGKEIKTFNFTGSQLVIEKGEMNTGVYFVQTIDFQKHICNKKIIIQ